MTTKQTKQARLKSLPGVDHLLMAAGESGLFRDIPRTVILDALRTTIDSVREDILADGTPDTGDAALLDRAAGLAGDIMKNRLIPLINATGVVLHTNLGRALLCRDALDNIGTVSASYSNLELNVKTGKRGIRYAAIEDLICELTGAEAALAVNNNAGAVLLALNTIAQGTEVVVSRGELVEIGGSFRVPDVMTKSGCCLKEVGTTNRTHLRDYEGAVNENTGLFLKVHTSNYKIQGFTASVSLKDMVTLGREKSIPVMEDLGSGTLIDFGPYGMPAEPLVSDRVAAGADVVTFSGDKLLGGPQAGIIVGRKETINLIKANPLTRALRIDKLTLAALESTLKLYRDKREAVQKIPTLRMLTMSYEVLARKAGALYKDLEKAIGPNADLEMSDMESRPGGGSYPDLKLPTCAVTIQPRQISVSALEKELRAATPPVIGRIEDNRYIIDPRTIQAGQEEILINTLTTILNKK
ncbi:MAG: L-seryl-tRNA(Sec) selenium transferase [Desulfobacterales bacterium]|nr:L-seryl-tRNA(Sec) selenium transferase [Desulfobacterales bacterium]